MTVSTRALELKEFHCCSLCPTLLGILHLHHPCRVQKPGKFRRDPGCCTMEGILNMSQHHSHSNMPFSRLIGLKRSRYEEIEQPFGCMLSMERRGLIGTLTQYSKFMEKEKQERGRKGETGGRGTRQSNVSTYSTLKRAFRPFKMFQTHLNMDY